MSKYKAFFDLIKDKLTDRSIPNASELVEQLRILVQFVEALEDDGK